MESNLRAKDSGLFSTAYQSQSGVFTRTRCRTYLQSQFHGPSSEDLQAGLLHSPRKKPKRLPRPDEFPSKDGDEVSQFITKDLRIKRVFSPNLPDENHSSVPSEGKISDKEEPIIANESCTNEDREVRKSPETPEVQNVDVCNSKPCLRSGYVELGNEDLRCNGVSMEVNGNREELTHSTPPDAEILAGDFLDGSSDGCPRSSNGCVEGETYANADIRTNPLSRTGSVLKPCFKRKLFKAPGSIAYKRLLPYLLDSDNFTLQGDLYSKRENNLEKRANIEPNPCNRAKESSSIDSDTCVKNAVFSSGMSCKAMKLSLPTPDKILPFIKPSVNGDTPNVQNSNPSENQKCRDSYNNPTLVKEGSGLARYNVVCASSHGKRLPENGGPTKHQIEDLSHEEQYKTSGFEKLDGGNSFISPNISSEVENAKLYDPKKSSNYISKNMERKDSFNEDALRMSSLDSSTSCNPEKEDRRDERVECTRGADQNLGSSTVSENRSNIAIDDDKKNGSHLRNKMVRNPLVQLKLFSSQVSVSYRRMLPFLEDLFKDNSENCALGNVGCPGLEKGLETMHLQSPHSNSHNALDKLEDSVSCQKPCDGSSGTLSTTELTTLNETGTETGVNDKLLSPPKLQLQQLHSERETLDKSKLEMDPQLHGGAILLNDQGAVSSLNPAASYEPLTGEVSRIPLNDQAAVSSSNPAAIYEPLTGEGSRMISKQSPITSEDCTTLTDNISHGAKLSEKNSLGSNSSCVEACILPENPTNVKKGILKRNPRGCRGICTCLNCSSFRLHADRAFEFSRHQLQDAEEVASDLMKELSFLRNMIEKSADGVKDDDGYHSNQVKEACRKASEAELIAKDRLLQMNYELGIHCRITCSQRPNVRFSGEVEKWEIEDAK